MTFKTDDLLLLAEVQRAGSLSAGARALSLPKATLSRRLAALEAAVGSRVFVPGARRLKLTEFGAELAERAVRHREDIEDTRHWIGAHEARPRGHLRISAPADFAALLLAEPMVRFVQRHPEISLEIDTAPRTVDLINEPYDVAVRIGPLEDSNLMARRLMLLERGLYASPNYLKDHSAPQSVAELREHRFVALQQSMGVVLRLMRAKRSVEFKMEGALQTNSLGLVHAMVVAGYGLGVLPHDVARNAVATGALFPVLPEWHFEQLPVSLLTASRKLMPAKVRVFIDHLLDTASESAV